MLRSLPFHRTTLASISFLTLATAAVAQVAPPILVPVNQVPPQAVAWNNGEKAGNPAITQTRFVRVNTDILRGIPVLGAAPLATLRIDLFGDTALFDVARIEWTLDYQSFNGKMRGHDGSAHIVVAPDGVVSGLFHLGAQSFQLAYAAHSDIHVLQELDQTNLPAHMGCACDHTHAVSEPPQPLLDGPNTDCGKTTLDLLVFYTPRARQRAGGTSAMQTVVVNAVNQANAGNLASGVNAEFRLVHTAETNYSETGGGNDLSRFRGTSDGHMDEVHALRTTYGGDLMKLITDPASPGFCGVAYLMTNLSTGFRTSAFGVTVRTCIGGHTFTHEIGHNIGSHHDPANAGNALYNYSYGYRTPNNQYRTIMSYSPGQRVNRWSSPTVNYQGFTMGVANAQDNKRSINNSRTTVSNFYPTEVPIWCDLTGGIAGLAGEPTVTGSGTMNLVEPFDVTVRQYRPNAIGVLIIGLTQANISQFGGTLIPNLDVMIPITGNGSPIVYNSNWLSLMPTGFRAWYQAAFLDAAAVQGISASDGVRVTIP